MSLEGSIIKKEVRDFYSFLPSGLEDTAVQTELLTKDFFEETRVFRYKMQPFHFEICEFEHWKGRKVLEIGIGMGVDHCEFAKNGAIMTGIDITPRHIEITRARLQAYGLQSNLIVADAEYLPFPSSSFDLVYSFGVLLILPDIQRAIDEIHRVLKPGGKAIIMLYHKNSVYYYLRTVLFQGIIWGDLWNRSLRTLVNWSTDGYVYPLSNHFTKKEAKNLLNKFKNIHTNVYYLHKHHFPYCQNFISKEIVDFYSKRFGLFLVIDGEK